MLQKILSMKFTKELMLKKIVFFILISISFQIFGQDLKCIVTVNFDQIPGSNRSVFKTLEKSINEFVNQKKWTNKEVRPQERINCAMNIILTKWENSSFEASIQVQSTRPVYNTSYETPVFNIRDNDFNFNYNEFDQLIYNPTRFDSNLVSTIAFYAYIILGLDADTFANNGGQKYLLEAQNVMLQAQQSGLSSWSNQVGKTNRFLLIDNLLSPNLQTFRSVMYNYHKNGLDNFSKDQLAAKQTVENNLIQLEKIFNKSVANYLIRIFFDAKAEEIVNLYSDGPKTRSFQRTLQILQKISPNNSNRWGEIN